MSADRIERQLSLARQGLTPAPQLRVRVRAQFGASERLAPAAAPTGGSALRDRWRALRASGNLGLAFGAGLFGLGCVVGLLGSELAPRVRDEAASIAPPHADEPVSSSVSPILATPSHNPQPAAEASAAPLAERALAAPALPAPSAMQRATSDAARGRSESWPPRRATRPRDWRGELELLERAERAVRADNVALALALLGDFDVRYPESRLIEERSAVETMAYCQTVATDSGMRAVRFLKLYPSSLYRARLEAVCPPAASAAAKGPDKKNGAGH